MKINIFLTIYTNINYLLGTLSKDKLSKTSEKKRQGQELKNAKVDKNSQMQILLDEIMKK